MTRPARTRRRRYRDLRDYLKKTGQSQAQYAERLGVTQAALSYIVNGVRPASKNVAFTIHADTGIPLEDLMQVTGGRS